MKYSSTENLWDRKGRFESQKQLAKLMQAFILHHSTLRNNEKEMKNLHFDFDVSLDTETGNKDKKFF